MWALYFGKTPRARWFAVVLLILALASPVAEAWDSWDQALPSGNDTEISALVVTLSVGLALVLAASVRRWLSAFLSIRSWSDVLIRLRPVRNTVGCPRLLLPFAVFALRI
jgi:hypothetical protein